MEFHVGAAPRRAIQGYWTSVGYRILKLVLFLPVTYFGFRILGGNLTVVGMDVVNRLITILLDTLGRWGRVRVREWNTVEILLELSLGLASVYLNWVYWTDDEIFWRMVSTLGSYLPGGLSLKIGSWLSMIRNSFLMTQSFLGVYAIATLIFRLRHFIRRWIYGKIVAYLQQKVGEGGKTNSGIAQEEECLCVVCQERIVCFMARPCKHASLCEICVLVMARLRDERFCLMCRARVIKYQRVFL